MSFAENYAHYDLDLHKLDTMDNPELIVPMVSSLINADSDYKIMPARQWLENFLYFSGSRSLTSAMASSTVTGRSMNMPSTNVSSQVSRRRIPKLFKAVQALASNTTRQKPSIKVWPVGEDEKSDSKAKMSNLLLDYLWSADMEDDLNYEVMLWALLTPMGVRKDFISYEFDPSRLWPVLNQQLNQQTGQVEWLPQLNKNGQPTMQQMPWNKTEIHSAFNVFMTPSASWVNGIDFVGDVQVKRIDNVIQEMNRNEEGYYQNNLNDLKPGAWNFTALMSLQASMKQMTFGSTRMLRTWNYNYVALKDGVICVDVYIKPSPNFPKGRRLYIANGKMLYDGKSPAFREHPKVSWHPYSFLNYERVPGRVWGTTYAEKLTDLQRSYEQARTEWDQMRRTMAVPKMVLPIGAQIERDMSTGNEEVLRYNPFGPGGGMPSYMTSPQPSTVIMDDVKMMQQEFVEISGITEIMQGIRPQGVSTYRGLATLEESARNMQNNFIRMYEQLIQNGQWNKLENLRYCLQYPNKNLSNAIRVFKKVKQYLTDIDVQDFIGDDLAGFVEIEPMSSIGKSKIALQEKYASLAQMGILGDVVNDPDLNSEFKRKMDIIGFDRPQNKQVTMARYENQIMLQSEQQGQPIVPPIHEWDDDAIHIREIDNLLNDPAMLNKPMIIQSLIGHRQLHQQKMAQLMAQQMQQQMAAQSAAAGVGGGSPQGNGSGFTTQANLGQGGPDELMFAPESGGANSIEGAM